MNIFAAVLMVFFFCSVAHAEDSQTKKDLTIIDGQFTHVLTKEDFRSIHFDSLVVQDPVYGKRKNYAGYWLADVFALAGIHLDPNAVLTFTALDGYKVQVNEADVLKYGVKAFVAVRDLDASEDWIKIKQGKQMISPGPYYLVWQLPVDGPAQLKLPWPYEMVEISITNTNQDEQKAFPDDPSRTATVSRGYQVFKINCMSCHSVNLQGGGLGPELNIPKNILEYENREFLQAFIADPSSFRAQSKMPTFKGTLTDQQIQDVLDYLAWMGKHKQ